LLSEGRFENDSQDLAKEVDDLATRLRRTIKDRRKADGRKKLTK